MINPYTTGDQVRHVNWPKGEFMTVEAVSRDGSRLWLFDGALFSTFGYSCPELWEKVEPFFEEGESYISDYTGRTYKVDHLGADSRGEKFAILVAVSTPHVLIQRQSNFASFSER